MHPAVDILRSFGRKWLRLIEKLFPGWLEKQKENVSATNVKDWRYNNDDDDDHDEY